MTEMNDVLEPEKPEYLPTICQSVKLLLGYFLIMFIPVIVLGIVYALLHLPSDPLTNVVATTVGLVLLIAWIRRKRTLGIKPLFSTKNVAIIYYPPMALVVLGMGIILSECDNVLQVFLPMNEFWVETFTSMLGGETGLWKSILAVAIAAPIVEEILFRGIILRGFLQHYSTRKAILVSALLFGLFHLNPWQFFGAFVAGIVTAWWFVKTRSLVMPIFIHVLYNSMSYILRFLGIEIAGYNAISATGFQPWWFDILGIILLAVGAVILYRMFVRSEPLGNGQSTNKEI